MHETEATSAFDLADQDFITALVNLLPSFCNINKTHIVKDRIKHLGLESTEYFRKRERKKDNFSSFFRVPLRISLIRLKVLEMLATVFRYFV